MTKRAAPRLVFGAATKVGHVGARRVTGKKADDEAETGCTDGERKLRICHSPREINSRHAEQTDLRVSADFVSVDSAGGASRSQPTSVTSLRHLERAKSGQHTASAAVMNRKR